MERRNPRQIEMAERLDEMFELACEIQKERLSKVKDPTQYDGIHERHFKAIYFIKCKVGEYAIQRYFRNFLMSDIFKSNPKIITNFKVAQEHYDRWFKDPNYRP